MTLPSADQQCAADHADLVRRGYTECQRCRAALTSNERTPLQRLREIVENQAASVRFLPVDMELLRRVVATDETECAHCREVYEIYAGMEGFQPETAPEGYQCRIIEQMREAAEKGLHRQVCELHPHYYLPCPSCVDRKRRAQKTPARRPEDQFTQGDPHPCSVTTSAPNKQCPYCGLWSAADELRLCCPEAIRHSSGTRSAPRCAVMPWCTRTDPHEHETVGPSAESY
jgi:hypothetical protein